MSTSAAEQGRRDFLKTGAVLGGAAAAGVSLTSPAAAASALPLPEYERWDATEIARLIRRGGGGTRRYIGGRSAPGHDQDGREAERSKETQAHIATLGSPGRKAWVFHPTIR